MNASFPIFVRAKDTGEVVVCGSVYDFQFLVEKIDIDNNEYDVWDKTGMRVKPITQRPVWITLPVVERDTHGLDIAITQHAERLGLKIDLNAIHAHNYESVAGQFTQVSEEKKPVNLIQRLWPS